jgi:uncharacterized membrane protein YfcA
MFMVFPALLFGGVAPIMANATASLALMPGGWASTWVYRQKLASHGKTLAWGMAASSLLGGTIGSELLLHTSDNQFAKLVPWLMLGAVLAFTFAGQIRRFASSHSAHGLNLTPLLVGQFLLTIYGGYFGAGLGVLMLALFLITTNMDIQTVSGLRIMCGSLTNLIAVAIFSVRGIVNWTLGVPMFVCAILGGYVGAQLIKNMGEETARRVILVYAWGITLWLIARTYL